MAYLTKDNKMLELSKVVGIQTEVVDGKSVEKQLYEDGSYGIDLGDGKLEVHYPNKDIATFVANGKGAYRLFEERLADGTHRQYDVFVHDTRTSRLVGMYNRGRGAMRRVAKHYLKSETLPDGTVNTYYPYGEKESVKRPDGTYNKWSVKGRLLQEVRADNTVIDYKYDGSGRVIYHAVNGKEDTIKYLAMRKVAERQAKKSEKLRAQKVEYTDANGNVKEKQVVKKLNPLQKAVQMVKAMREVKKNIQNR